MPIASNSGRSPASAGSGHSPKGGAASASPAKPSVPNAASRRRTFKPFARAPRDGTPFIIPHIARYNPFAKTFEFLMQDQYGGEYEWVPTPRIWRSIHFCDLLPLPYDLPKTFAVTFVASPVRQPTWRERLMDKLFGWLRLPDVGPVMRYCLLASAIEAATAGETAQTGSTEGESAARNAGDAR